MFLAVTELVLDQQAEAAASVGASPTGKGSGADGRLGGGEMGEMGVCGQEVRRHSLKGG